MKDTKDVAGFDRPSPWLINIIRQEVERLNKLSVSPPLELVNQGGGPSIRLIGYQCWVKITAVGTTENGITPYAWQEQQENGDGSFSDLGGGRQGTVSQNPLYESNKSATVPVGTIVEAKLGVAGEWYFTEGGCGGSGSGNSIQFPSGTTCIQGIPNLVYSTLSITDGCGKPCTITVS
jgi:hypothetical protein